MNCPHCNQPVQGRKNKRFCNRSHMEMYHRAQGNRVVNLTGKCLECEAPVPVGQKYCCDLCGKNYRYKTKYSDANYVKTPKITSGHVCTPECTARFGFCMTLRNLEKRTAHKQNRIPSYRLGVLEGVRI